MTQIASQNQSSRATLWDMPHGQFGARQIVHVFALFFGIWHILTNVYLTEPGLWQNAIHFASFAFLASLTLRAKVPAKHGLG